MQTRGWRRLYLQSEVEFLQRSTYLGRESVHPLALLESNDHVWSPVFNRNLGHDFLHDERVRQTADNFIKDRLDLHEHATTTTSVSHCHL